MNIINRKRSEVRLDEILESIPNYEMYELYDPIDESQEIIQDQQNTQKVYNSKIIPDLYTIVMRVVKIYRIYLTFYLIVTQL